ncbi:hypothetical protein EIP91_010019 [Steccherinum ochraceum]|uniref:Uncharacterized protein n=1 Tax=Steccherinum ochraceum TaxID=92696 RepID=A0A4V2MUZ8_9APHY|nr:hypothetical protein EIP91_010019 [Steccherinum ochraceum]
MPSDLERRGDLEATTDVHLDSHSSYVPADASYNIHSVPQVMPTEAEPMLTISDPENPGRRDGTNEEQTIRPPLLVSLTGYRLSNMTVMVAFGTAKAVLAWKGQSALPTALDWISGVVFFVISYWAGLYETVHPPVWPWFFHQDYSRSLARIFVLLPRSACTLMVRNVLIPVWSINLIGRPLWLMLSIFLPLTNHRKIYWLLWVPIMAAWTGLCLTVSGRDDPGVWVLQKLANLFKVLLPTALRERLGPPFQKCHDYISHEFDHESDEWPRLLAYCIASLAIMAIFTFLTLKFGPRRWNSLHPFDAVIMHALILRPLFATRHHADELTAYSLVYVTAVVQYIYVPAEAYYLV